MAHCKIAPHLYQKVLSNACQYIDLCYAKVETGKHSTLVLMSKGMKKDFLSNKNMEYTFCFYPNNIKRCMNENNKKCVLDLPIVPNMWTIKIGTNLLMEEVLNLKTSNSNCNRVMHYPSLGCNFCATNLGRPINFQSSKQCVGIQQHRW